ncbi:MAG TPA: hypothetical protein PKX87_02625 [Alphaproteobacteria bacterium]|nr:hypothetical protein [Alphaproteobacteria bacterium]
MCVDTKGLDWERPAVASDIPTLSKSFPNVDFEGLLEAMSQDGAKPLTTDLALVGAMMNTPPDDLGMRYVPFTGLKLGTREVVKLPVMDQIVNWLENTALGTDMWANASEWCESRNGTRVHFAMNCGCGLVATSGYRTGQWKAWKARFNASRADVFGKTSVVRAETNALEGLDITPAQLQMWHRMRACLESLPAARQDMAKAA